MGTVVLEGSREMPATCGTLLAPAGAVGVVGVVGVVVGGEVNGFVGVVGAGVVGAGVVG